MLRAELPDEAVDGRLGASDAVEVVEHHFVDDVGGQHDVVDGEKEDAVLVDVELRTLLANQVEVVGLVRTVLREREGGQMAHVDRAAVGDAARDDLHEQRILLLLGNDAPPGPQRVALRRGVEPFGVAPRVAQTAVVLGVLLQVVDGRVREARGADGQHVAPLDGDARVGPELGGVEEPVGHLLVLILDGHGSQCVGLDVVVGVDALDGEDDGQQCHENQAGDERDEQRCVDNLAAVGDDVDEGLVAGDADDEPFGLLRVPARGLFVGGSGMLGSAAGGVSGHGRMVWGSVLKRLLLQTCGVLRHTVGGCCGTPHALFSKDTKKSASRDKNVHEKGGMKFGGAPPPGENGAGMHAFRKNHYLCTAFVQTCLPITTNCLTKSTRRAT